MIKNHLKTAWRNLSRNKTYTVINVLGLTLGITCTILIFAFVKYHLSFDNFHKNKDRIYRIVTEAHQDNVEYLQGVPTPLGKAFRNDYAFAELTVRLARFGSSQISFIEKGTIKRLQENNGISFAEPGFLNLFNFPLKTGDRKNLLTEPNTAVITEHLARKYFGKENPVGKTIRMDNKVDMKITGVLQNVPVNTDFKQEIYASFITLKQKNAWLAADNWDGISSAMQCFTRLKPGVTEAQVEKIFPALEKKYLGKDELGEYQFKLQPLSDVHFNTAYDGETSKTYLLTFSLIGVFLIITACVNFINLATAMALKRSKEIGVRKAIGGMRGQLFWQFITETAVIALFALTISVGAAKFCLPIVNNQFHSSISINLFHDVLLVGFLLILSALIIFLSGAYPGLVLSGFNPVAALKGKITQKQVGGFSLRRVLVIVQFAISQMLIIGTLIVSAQLYYSTKTDLGFQKNGIVLLPIADSSLAKMNTLKIRLLTVSATEKISFCNQPPASNNINGRDILYSNRPKNETFEVNEKKVDEQYVNTFGLKIVAGRNLFPSDTTREYLVNETMVKKLGLKSAQEIIGKNAEINGQKGTVVGVVKDFHDKSFRSAIGAMSFSQGYYNYEYAAVKVNLATMQTALKQYEKIWKQVYPEATYSVEFTDEKIARFYEADTLILNMIRVFSGIAIFIGCLGLYGLVSFMVSLKTKEIGVRKVLGANIPDILWLFGREFALLLLLAFLIGAPVAGLAMYYWLQDFAYKISISPWFFAGSITISFAIAICTVGYRSVKAALANPVKSLRTE